MWCRLSVDARQCPGMGGVAAHQPTFKATPAQWYGDGPLVVLSAAPAHAIALQGTATWETTASRP